MGRPRKLRSSIKALHDALTSFRPAVGAPMCIQPAKTHSFRDLLTSFNSIYYPPPTSSSSFSNPSSHHSLLHCPQILPCSEISPTYNGEGDEEEAVSISASTVTTSNCSSCLSSSSLAVTAKPPNNANEDDAGAEAETFPSDITSSERFFFTPCTSKSIMDESFTETCSKKMKPLRLDPLLESQGARDYENEDHVFDLLMEREIDTLIEGATSTGISALCRESIPTAVASRDPYRDFRSSMEEMVAAYGLRDWPGLQELLHSYLLLNEKTTHRLIVLAFIDLLMHLASEGKVHSSAVHGAFFTPTFPSPLLPTPQLHPCPSEY